MNRGAGPPPRRTRPPEDNPCDLVGPLFVEVDKYKERYPRSMSDIVIAAVKP
jgi:hypothetical protein